MTWNMNYEGRATDFIPDLLKTSGSPGVVASMARDALWEAVQKAGERNPGAWVVVRANGWEEKEAPGLGNMSLAIQVLEDAPSPVESQLRAQQPVNLLQAPEATSAASARTVHQTVESHAG